MCANTVSLNDVILAGICTLQERNGVTAGEIAEYVAKKRSCKLRDIEGMIKIILSKATNHGILNEKEGQFRIHPKYDDLPKINIAPVRIPKSESSDEGEDNPRGVAKPV